MILLSIGIISALEAITYEFANKQILEVNTLELLDMKSSLGISFPSIYYFILEEDFCRFKLMHGTMVFMEYWMFVWNIWNSGIFGIMFYLEYSFGNCCLDHLLHGLSRIR